MRTYSFINLKGGVGKTTISKNTAVLIAKKYGGRVLYVDNDKQGNATSFFDVKQDKTIADLFINDANVADVICHTRYKNIDIITADMDLQTANYEMLKMEGTNQFMVLLDKLSEVAVNYDVCIIDNPPDINLSVMNGLILADEVILVATPDDDALDGIDKMIEQIELARQANSSLELRGCVMNKHLSRPYVYEYQSELKKRCNIIANIRYVKDKVNMANKEKVSIFEYSDRCGFASDMKNFVAKLLRVRK
jgi:chromosome partitioning protein